MKHDIPYFPKTSSSHCASAAVMVAEIVWKSKISAKVRTSSSFLSWSSSRNVDASSSATVEFAEKDTSLSVIIPDLILRNTRV